MQALRRPSIISVRHGQVRQLRWLSAEPSPITVQHHPAPHSGSIRVLLLDRPETRNALSRRLVADLNNHVQQIREAGSQGGIRALIIASSNDKAFCAGADLKERRGMSQDEFVSHARLGQGETNIS